MASAFSMGVRFDAALKGGLITNVVVDRSSAQELLAD